MNNKLNYIKILRIGLIILLLEIIFLIYSVFNTIQIKNSTGIISVTSSNNKDSIVIGQPSHQFYPIGTGAAKVSLYPGSYIVESINGNQVDVKTVNVKKKSYTSVNLNPSTIFKLPYLENLSFINASALSNAGLTSTQVSMFQNLIYGFNPYAKTITIETDTISASPPNPANQNPFSIKFKFVIDSTNYNASINYGSNLNTISLNIYNQAGSLIISE